MDSLQRWHSSFGLHMRPNRHTCLWVYDDFILFHPNLSFKVGLGCSFFGEFFLCNTWEEMNEECLDGYWRAVNPYDQLPNHLSTTQPPEAKSHQPSQTEWSQRQNVLLVVLPTCLEQRMWIPLPWNWSHGYRQCWIVRSGRFLSIFVTKKSWVKIWCLSWQHFFRCFTDWNFLVFWCKVHFLHIFRLLQFRGESCTMATKKHEGHEELIDVPWLQLDLTSHIPTVEPGELHSISWWLARNRSGHLAPIFVWHTGTTGSHWWMLWGKLLCELRSVTIEQLMQSVLRWSVCCLATKNRLCTI